MRSHAIQNTRWVRVSAGVLTDPDLTPADLRLLLTIHSHADLTDGALHLPLVDVAATLHVRRETASRSVSRLVACGYLVRTRGHAGRVLLRVLSLVSPKPSTAPANHQTDRVTPYVAQRDHPNPKPQTRDLKPWMTNLATWAERANMTEAAARELIPAHLVDQCDARQILYLENQRRAGRLLFPISAHDQT